MYHQPQILTRRICHLAGASEPRADPFTQVNPAQVSMLFPVPEAFCPQKDRAEKQVRWHVRLSPPVGRGLRLRSQDGGRLLPFGWGKEARTWRN